MEHSWLGFNPFRLGQYLGDGKHQRRSHTGGSFIQMYSISDYGSMIADVVRTLDRDAGRVVIEPLPGLLD